MSRSDLVIRPLEGRAELEACVALQEAVWGGGFEERVPAAILGVARRLGGIVTGAFLGGELVGFVFGLTGLRDGEPVHWSDMLAVRRDLRGKGVGRSLKEAQRTELLARGVHVVEWTFDPLEARNAHLNLNALGAVGVSYLEDAYGQSSSPLHQGIGTDRLVVRWRLDEPLVRPSPAPPEATPLLEPDGGSRDVPLAGTAVPAPAEAPVTVAVPLRIQELKERAPAEAVRWRTASRAAFQSALAGGRVAVAGWPSQEDGVFRYLLDRPLGPRPTEG